MPSNSRYRKNSQHQISLKCVFGKNPDLRFGGDLMIGKRKSERVLVSRRAIHLVIKIHPRGDAGRESFKSFVRAMSGLIARKILQADRGAAKLKFNESFWSARPYTRVLSSTKSDYQNLHHYITLNKLEAIGFDRSAWEMKQKFEKRQDRILTMSSW